MRVRIRDIRIQPYRTQENTFSVFQKFEILTTAGFQLRKRQKPVQSSRGMTCSRSGTALNLVNGVR